jgi:uncharacterized SAM-binding protein YcdF (DUF218 family)
MLSDLASVLLVPPVNLVLLAGVGVALSWRQPGSRTARLGRWLAAAALALLVLLALPVVSGSLLASLEAGLPATAPGRPPQAIVILGGDTVPLWPDLGDEKRGEKRGRLDIGILTLERLRGGAALQRATRLPVLVTGGVVDRDGEPVAILMARSLPAEFGVPVRWVDAAASDTWQNAQFSAAILKRAGIGTVYVVTHAWHMRRALIAFGQAGITAVPAPLTLDRPPRGRSSGFVPRVASWQRSYFALHEWIGCAWYAWRRLRGDGRAAA